MLNKICPLPWNHLAVQQNGDFRVCCQSIYPPFAKISDENGMMNIATHTIEQARNSTLSTEIRRSQLAGEEHSACKLCYDQERLGQTSKRQHMVKEYGIDNIKDETVLPLQYWDLRFGNLCNLACRSCGPNDSSQWYDDFVSLNSEQKTTFNFYGGNNYPLKKINNAWVINSDDFNFYELDTVWGKIKETLLTVDRLYLTGGEPLINKSNRRLLELCVELDVAHKITLEYNTNMTTVPEWLLDTWSKFKKVNIGCSIDAVGELAYYVRYPSDWPKIEQNLDQLGHVNYRNIYAKLAVTVSVYNVLHYPSLLLWLYNKDWQRIKNVPSYHMLDGPEWLNIQVLPAYAKEYVEAFYKDWLTQHTGTAYEFWHKQLHEIINHMWARDLSEYLPKLKHHTKVLDTNRNQNGRDYLPWLFGILDKVLDSNGLDQYW
jgi:sulfatase maturation enzyme AslB (radical SAM superfamily)